RGRYFGQRTGAGRIAPTFRFGVLAVAGSFLGFTGPRGTFWFRAGGRVLLLGSLLAFLGGFVVLLPLLAGAVFARFVAVRFGGVGATLLLSLLSGDRPALRVSLGRIGRARSLALAGAVAQDSVLGGFAVGRAAPHQVQHGVFRMGPRQQRPCDQQGQN